MSCKLLLRFLIGAIAMSGPNHVESKSHRHPAVLRLRSLGQQSQQGCLFVGYVRGKFCDVDV
eukprot:1093425-Prorocentrum_lima.AAC.1